jgi:hypothetical protein
MKDKLGGVYVTYERCDKCIQKFQFRTRKEGYVDSIILKRISKEQDTRMWTAIILWRVLLGNGPRDGIHVRNNRIASVIARC